MRPHGFLANTGDKGGLWGKSHAIAWSVPIRAAGRWPSTKRSRPSSNVRTRWSRCPMPCVTSRQARRGASSRSRWPTPAAISGRLPCSYPAYSSLSKPRRLRFVRALTSRIGRRVCLADIGASALDCSEGEDQPARPQRLGEVSRTADDALRRRHPGHAGSAHRESAPTHALHVRITLNDSRLAHGAFGPSPWTKWGFGLRPLLSSPFVPVGWPSSPFGLLPQAWT